MQTHRSGCNGRQAANTYSPRLLLLLVSFFDLCISIYGEGFPKGFEYLSDWFVSSSRLNSKQKGAGPTPLKQSLFFSVLKGVLSESHTS